MAKLLELRQRIRAVENVLTITRTLATVAAAKLSRTRRRAAGLRPYAGRVREILHRQRHRLGSALLGNGRPVRSVVLLVVTGDRGMCGGYNLEACRLALQHWKECTTAGQRVGLVLVGRKGLEYFRKRKAAILHHESWRRAGVGADDVERLLRLLLGLYRSGEADAIDAVYTEFHSPIRRRPRVVRFLPIRLPEPGPQPAPAGPIGAWHYEPALEPIVEELLEVYLRVQLYDVLLASFASEQGARMITMEEATERAEKALQEYRVQHNRLRREAITIDLLGAVFAAGAAAEAAPAPGRR